ncbi:MAG: site-2 protease family protein [Candidatus Pacebacteria bacterium]|nr:site-2 protease family protein [Candidatus Paceibacterota bacterium]
MTIILFIIVLLVTVLVHEWGHYIAAKKSGMTVEEFGFGIPPRLCSWKRGETTYSINALPFGGFVKIAGENGLEEKTPVDKQFESKPWYKQSIVLVAGVVCNILLAILLFTISYSIGTPSLSDNGTPTVLHVTKGSPIDEAGIKIGDTIVSVSKYDKEITPIDTETLRNAIAGSNDPLEITFVHGQTESNVSVSPRTEDGVTAIGLGVEKVALEKTSLGKSFIQANKQTFFITKSIFKTVGNLVAGLFSKDKNSQDLIGPIGLATEIKNASNIGFGYLLAFTAMISINLAVINILPFPALDGGRLIIVLLERITRRKFSKTVVGIIHATGFVLLIGLMIFLSIGDVGRLL